MTLVGYVVGFADFQLSLPLWDAAIVISERFFGGIRFVKQADDDQSVFPTLTLAHDFAGIGAELISSKDSDTIEISTRPSSSVEEVSGIRDLSAMLKQQFALIPGLTLLPPAYE